MALRMRRNERVAACKSPRPIHRRLRSSVNDSDHRNAGFVGGTDKRCSRGLSRNLPVYCVPASHNRHEIFFSIVDGPANGQHLGGLNESCDELVFFRPTHHEHQRGKFFGYAPLHDIRSPHGKYISNRARTVPGEAAA
ncbi:hypothetical protein RHE_CH00903 [Rhizobium etli CFN 42]|uniref:Uncharacterized protein n=1 Tax=Rhizobium etli (strain ATCC 51251 / DSM 11541 / JCM 21823 / NBRC 15573 / CFN 42) TaxID=347834 RepID=Q2KBS2_RHIEC|nr:hypothetical protein RHE_CH00903 [Rhizobium etli CFN 42]